MTDTEQILHEILAKLREDYMRAAQPYIDQLATIQAAKMPPPIYISTEQAIALGLLQEDNKQ